MKKPKKAAPKAPSKKKPAAKAAPKKSAAAKKPATKKPAAAGTTHPASKAAKKNPPAKAKPAPAKKPSAGTTHASSKAKATPPKTPPAKAAPAKETPAAKSASAKDAKSAGATHASSSSKAKAAKEPKAAPVVETIPALTDVKRPAKPFFMEVKPGVERVIKRGDKTAASQAIDLQARRKGPTAEETPEELAERIERELQSQSFMRRVPVRRQMCTKCGINVVTPRFTIDRELGYCEICAEILRLGETKEAKRMEFNLSLKKEGEGSESGEGGDSSSEESEEEAVPEDLDD